MRIINPNVELIKQTNPVYHVAKCASICYGKDEAKNPEALYERLKNDGHLSVFRHESIYAIIPSGKLAFMDVAYKHCPYIDIRFSGNQCYIATNKHFIFDHANDPFIHLIIENQVKPEYFYNTEVGYSMMRYTMRVTTQISTSRELNRVSPNSITERSTRYVYEDGTLCRPHWLEGYKISQGLRGGLYVYKDENTEIEMNNKVRLYIEDCERSFNTYKELVDYGLPRQDARGVLPIDTATICYYTYSVDEWWRIYNLRSSKRAHPNANIIANLIKEKLNELSYDI